MERFIVITGNPVDGLTFYGPFVDAEAANAWADQELYSNDEWWVTALHAPEGV